MVEILEETIVWQKMCAIAMYCLNFHSISVNLLMYSFLLMIEKPCRQYCTFFTYWLRALYPTPCQKHNPVYYFLTTYSIRSACLLNKLWWLCEVYYKRDINSKYEITCSCKLKMDKSLHYNMLKYTLHFSQNRIDHNLRIKSFN